MKLLHTIPHPSRLHDIKFCKRLTGEGEFLLVAAEDKMISVYNMSKDPECVPTIIAEMTGHTNRSVEVDVTVINYNHFTQPHQCQSHRGALPQSPSMQP